MYTTTIESWAIATQDRSTSTVYAYVDGCYLAAAQACAPPPDAAVARPGMRPAGDGVQIGKAGESTMESTTWYRRVEE